VKEVKNKRRSENARQKYKCARSSTQAGSLQKLLTTLQVLTSDCNGDCSDKFPGKSENIAHQGKHDIVDIQTHASGFLDTCLCLFFTL
jgi:hypothetical protein